MPTAFSFISAVILMLFPIITDTYSEVSLRYLTMLGSTILVLLILSLGLALFVQWRFKYQALPCPKEILDHELENADNFNTPEQRNKSFAETLDDILRNQMHSGDRRKFCVIDDPRQYENLRLSQE